MGTLRSTSIALAVLASAVAAEAKAAPCADMETSFRQTAKRPTQAVTVRDIIEIRDIGDSYSAMSGFAERLAVSPDGTKVAFGVIRADIESNAYCRAVFVAKLRANSVPKIVDVGGGFWQSPYPIRGYRTLAGVPAPTIPIWSPDGRSIAFLRADDDTRQAWIANADGSGSRQATHARGGVTAITWSTDGRALLFASSPGAQAEQDAIEKEGDSGWHYDARVFASYQLKPLVGGEQTYAIHALDLATSTISPANAAEASRLTDPSGVSSQISASALALDGRHAWVERVGGGENTPVALKTSDATGRRLDCDAEWCRGGVYRVWWDPSGPELFVQRREGRDGEIVAFYRWLPGQTRARRFFATVGALQDCVWAAEGLACTFENSITPRRIVLIDRASGRSKTVFDPNPGLASFRRGTVRRFHVTNAMGLSSWGDLVLPPGYTSGQKLPLVVVQYKSQGFLRGGTGDEYPIYPLAERGFAVLSIERPPFSSSTDVSAKTSLGANTANFRNWVDRRNVLTSLELILDQVVATGMIDEKRIGITGLSDGASTIRFALLNSKRFAAAALSTCCLDPGSVMAINGPALADYFQKMGFPPMTRPDHDFWDSFSLAQAGNRTDVPLLLLLADREAYSALETFQALREYGKPIDMFVYPDEYHNKWQPRHKRSVAERAIDWFMFWLQGREDPDPAKAAQYARWRALRSLTPARAD